MYAILLSSTFTQRRLDSVPQSIMRIERLIPREASLTVDSRGVNISPTIKPIWKLSNEKSVKATTLCENGMLLLYCCVPHYDLCFAIPSLPFFKLHGTCCHFSFINNPSERRSCIIPRSEALLSKLDGVKSSCIINVKTSSVFKVGIVHCITVISLFNQVSALLFLFLSCNILWHNIILCSIMPLV